MKKLKSAGSIQKLEACILQVTGKLLRRAEMEWRGYRVNVYRCSDSLVRCDFTPIKFK